MARHLLLVAPGVDFADARPPGKPAQAVALENAVDAGVGDFDAVVSGVSAYETDLAG